MRPCRTLAVPVLAAVVLVLVAGCGTGKQAPAPSAVQAAHTDPAVARLITEVTTVPQGMLDAAAKNATVPTAVPSKVAGAPLTMAGKPEVFYDSAQFCPFCAVQNWPLIVALSRFGTFTGLTTIRSAPWGDGPLRTPPLDTWSFYHERYTSQYLAFVPVEARSNVLISPKAEPGHTDSYRRLQRLTTAQQALVDKYDVMTGVGTGSVPFLDFGNKTVLIGSLYDPSRLVTGSKALTWQQIADALRDPRSAAGQAIRTAAAYLTADICALTGDQPASVCTPAVRSLRLLS